MQCQARTAKNEKCRAPAITGSVFCFYHDTKVVDARRAAQSRGGRKKVRAVLAVVEFDLSKPSEILKLLSAAANLTLTGRLNSKAGNTLVGLCDAALRASHAIAVVEKIKQLEQEQRAEKTLPFLPIDYLAPEFPEDEARSSGGHEDSAENESPTATEGGQKGDQ